MRYWDKHWRRKTWLTGLLLPVAALYCLVVWLRRIGYRLGLLRTTRLPVPVIVVGNITVGGTGKTPLVIWLVQLLRAAGWRPGIVTRGYRGRSPTWPITVEAGSDPALTGDEAVLLACRAACPVAAGPDRIAAARLLLDRCDVIVSDDGLQHYRLGRDVEIAVIDGARRLGNGLCLPAGPLRERPERLESVDAIITQGDAGPGEFGFTLQPTGFRAVARETDTLPVVAFAGRKIHALAGIGHPQRFFDTMQTLGARVIAQPWPDHHLFQPEDIRHGDGLPVIMTEKDAVKCRGIAGPEHWYLAVEPRVDPRLTQRIVELLNERRHG